MQEYWLVLHSEPRMSTQPHISSDDLDRTDELPVLDVAVYEASLAESGKGLSRTDTWSVEALQDIDELESSGSTGVVAPTHVAKSLDGGALTVNVDQILKRIAVLEDDIVKAHEANAALAKRGEAFEVQLEERAARIQTLEAENARLSEHRTLAIEMAERVERKLRQELQLAKTQIDEMHSAQVSARASSEDERRKFQDRIAQMDAASGAQQQEQLALRDRLQASITLANQRAESLATVEKLLSNEKAITAQLTRQFATKLSEYDKVASILGQRNRAIEELIRERDSLSERLRNQTASNTELAKELNRSAEGVEQARSLVSEREALLSKKEGEIARLNAQLEQLRGSLESAEKRTAEVQHALVAVQAARDEQEQHSFRLAAQLDQAQGRILRLETEGAAAQVSIRELSAERDALLPVSLELTKRTGEFEQKTQELAQAREQFAAARDAAEEQIRLLSAERDRLLPSSEELAARTAELVTRTQELAEAQEHHGATQGALQEQIRSLSEERDALLPAASLLKERVAELEQRELELAQLREELAAARAGEQEAATTLVRERDSMSSVSEQLAARAEEVERSHLELSQLREALNVAHHEAEKAARLLAEEREISSTTAVELTSQSAEIERRTQEFEQLREELAASLKASEDEVRNLNERVAELADLQVKVREQAGSIRGLELAVRARDELADQLKGQLQIAREERAIMAGQLEKVRGRVKSLTQEIFRRDHEISELRTDLAVHTEALEAIRRDVNRIGKDTPAESSNDVERVLEPVEHSGAPIFLTAKMLTIGRTAENDICVPSKLVSRHHARLLVGPNGVIVEDAGSTNGCFVNGEQVRQHLMHDGDVLELGDLRYRLKARTTSDTRVRTNVVPMFDGRTNT
jgi:chromosome segregation ATPase